MLASNHLGYGIDLFQESLYFVNCRREYAIRPLRVIPDSTNQLAALALKLNFLSNVEVPEVRRKLEYDATIQSMRNSSPPKRRNRPFLTLLEYLLFLGTEGGVASTERQNTSILWNVMED